MGYALKWGNKYNTDANLITLSITESHTGAHPILNGKLNDTCAFKNQVVRTTSMQSSNASKLLVT